MTFNHTQRALKIELENCTRLEEELQAQISKCKREIEELQRIRERFLPLVEGANHVKSGASSKRLGQRRSGSVPNQITECLDAAPQGLSFAELARQITARRSYLVFSIKSLLADQNIESREEQGETIYSRSGAQASSCESEGQEEAGPLGDRNPTKDGSPGRGSQSATVASSSATGFRI